MYTFVFIYLILTKYSQNVNNNLVLNRLSKRDVNFINYLDLEEKEKINIYKSVYKK